MSEPLIRFSEVSAGYRKSGPFASESSRVVNDLSFAIYPDECLGLVGGSGSGKSTIARLLTGLLEPAEGQIFYQNQELTKLSFKERLQATGTGIQMVFQDPFSSLNANLTVGYQLEEPLLLRGEKDSAKREQKARGMLSKVGLDQGCYRRYPTELSGGQLQRIAIACALLMDPSLLVADEPVSALDVSVQARVLDLFRVLLKEEHLSCLFISHDLDVIYYLCDRVLVLESGRIVEAGRVEEIYQNPQHPYTKNLLAAVRD